MKYRGLGALLAGLSLALGGGCGDDGADSNGTETQVSGIEGRDGIDGIDGRDGKSGELGAPGAPGAPGVPGAPGAPGAVGVSGDDGRDGVPGTNGTGEDGRDGLNGENGDDGAPGAEGQDGLNGRDGRDGRDGLGGVAGAPADDDDDTEEEPGPAPAPRIVALSLVGHDRFFGVAYDAAGNLYATGQVAGGIDATADYALFVAKMKPTGELDSTFGNDGVAVQNVAVGGTSRENARGIVVQSSGKIVIAGAAEHDPKAAGVLATDTDVVVLRFNADGTLDSTFGTSGIARLDLNSGLVGTNAMGVETLTSGDSQWALALAAGDKLVVHGTQRAKGFMPDGTTPRSDADWALVRLTADGVPDLAFGGDGKVTLDIGGAGASSRAITVLADGSIVAAGYLNSSALGQATQQPVLYKVTAAGEFDATFAAGDATTLPGVWHDLAVQPPLRAECYGAALQGDKLVTMGYGPTPGTGTGTDWVSFRFNANGERDLTYGTNGTNYTGATYLDAGGYGDNGRFVLVLPDNRVLGAGGGRPAPATPLPADQQPGTDGMVAVLTANGLPDTSFSASGFKLYDMGGTADFFWAAAISPDKKNVAIVGIAGATSATDDDDSALLLLPLSQ